MRGDSAEALGGWDGVRLEGYPLWVLSGFGEKCLGVA